MCTAKRGTKCNIVINLVDTVARGVGEDEALRRRACQAQLAALERTKLSVDEACQAQLAALERTKLSVDEACQAQLTALERTKARSSSYAALER